MWLTCQTPKRKKLVIEMIVIHMARALVDCEEKSVLWCVEKIATQI